MQWNRTKMFTYTWFMLIWTYFRHYLNIKIMYSVLTEFHLIPYVYSFEIYTNI